MEICLKCRDHVSEKARICPNCGYPQFAHSLSNCLWRSFFAFLITGGIVGLITMCLLIPFSSLDLKSRCIWGLILGIITGIVVANSEFKRVIIKRNKSLGKNK